MQRSQIKSYQQHVQHPAQGALNIVARNVACVRNVLYRPVESTTGPDDKQQQHIVQSVCKKRKRPVNVSNPMSVWLAVHFSFDNKIVSKFAFSRLSFQVIRYLPCLAYISYGLLVWKSNISLTLINISSSVW